MLKMKTTNKTKKSLVGIKTAAPEAAKSVPVRSAEPAAAQPAPVKPCSPQPVRRPPIVIGGDGEKKTLRLVAQYADVWNSTAAAEELPHKIEVLKRHCETVGRDFAEIRLTAAHFADPFTDLDAYLRTAERLAGLGIDLINAGPHPGNPDPVGFIERLGEQVIPRLAG